MFINAMNPYWWSALPINGLTTNNNTIERIDIGGIYKISTNAVLVTDESVDYGINPCLYRQLPNESIILLKIHSDVPTGGEALPITVAVPNSGTSTISTTSTSNSGTTKVGVVDSQGTPVTGANVQGNTERLMYLNKSTGTIRFLEFTNPATGG